MLLVKFDVFQGIFFGRTLVVFFWHQPLVLGGIGCGRRRMAKISRNKSNRGNIRWAVDLYDLFAYSIFFVPLFIIFSLYQHYFFFPHFCISCTRGKVFRKYWPSTFYSKDNRDSYEWLSEGLSVDGFNKACNIIAASYLKVGYESIIASIFGLHWRVNCLTCPIFSPFPGPLGTDFNTVACYVTGVLLFLEI